MASTAPAAVATDEPLVGILTRDVAMGARLPRGAGSVPPRRVLAGTEVEVVGETDAEGFTVVRLPGTRYRQRVRLAVTVRVP